MNSEEQMNRNDPSQFRTLGDGEAKIHRDELERDGYTIFRNLVDLNTIARLRESCLAHIERTERLSMLASELVRSPELGKAPFLPPIVGALSAVVGKGYWTIPEYAMLANSYGPWHRDTDPERDTKWVYSRNYRQYEVALYLQDNVVEYGGGIDVKPFSHRNLFALPRIGHQRPIRYARQLADLFLKPKTVETRRGDVVLWNFRLSHRATPARSLPVPNDRMKTAIFWGASPSREHAEHYLAFLRWRGYTNEFYRAISRVSFPSSYDDGVVDLVRQQNLNVASYDALSLG